MTLMVKRSAKSQRRQQFKYGGSNSFYLWDCSRS
jgi:hypothetical protein